MTTWILYAMFILYIITRVNLSIRYHATVKKHSKLFYAREDAPKENNYGNQISFQQMELEWEQMPLTKQIDREANKCKYLYNKDVIIKRVASIIFGILSLVILWFDFQTGIQKSSFFIAMLPGIVSLFNNFFEWFEIDLPVGFHSGLPPKF